MMALLCVTAAWAETVTDEITVAGIGNGGNSAYQTWMGKTFTSDAVYAGLTSGGNGASNACIQIKAKENSGIVTTASGGSAVKKVTVYFNSQTSSGTLQIYGKNTAYSSAADLYSVDTRGEIIGEISFGGNYNYWTPSSSQEFQYIGLRSKNGTIYIDKIEIEWEVPEEPPVGDEFGIKITPAPGEYTSPQNITISTVNAPEGQTPTITYAIGDGEDQTYNAPFTLYKSATITVMAECGDESDIQEYEYTINLPALAFSVSPAPGTYEGTQNVSFECTNAIQGCDLTVVWSYTPEEGETITGDQDNMSFTAVKSGELSIMAEESNTDREFNQTYNYTITEPISTDGMKIIFNDSDKDYTNDLSNDGVIGEMSVGGNLVQSVSDINKVYKGKTGLKFGTTSVDGTMTLNLKNKWTATKISFIAKNYNTSVTTFTVSYGDGEGQSKSFDLTTNLALYEFEFDNPQEVQNITFTTSGNHRAYLKAINIEGTEPLGVTVTPEAGVVYTAPVTVTITPTGVQQGDNVVISYTLNGGDPITYTEAFTLNETTVVSVTATRGQETATWQGTYTINLPIELDGMIVFANTDETHPDNDVVNAENFAEAVAKGADLIESVSDIDRVFRSDYGLKLGSANNEGKMTLNLKKAYKNAKISIIAKKYNNDDGVFYVNGEEIQLTSNFARYEITLDPAQEVQNIAFSTVGGEHRAYLKVIDIEGEEVTPAPTYTITLDKEPGTYDSNIVVKATVSELPEGAKLYYTFLPTGSTATAQEKEYKAGVKLFKSGTLTFILRDAENAELATAGGEYIVPLFGDVDGDGDVSVTDVNTVVNVILGKLSMDVNE